MVGTIVGLVLAAIGAMYRFAAFEVATAVVAFYVLGLSVSRYWAIPKDNRRFVEFLGILFEKRRLCFCIAVLMISFPVQYASKYVNNSTPELKYVSEYNSARTAVWDYPVPTYEECKEKYDSIGIDADDLAMLKLRYKISRSTQQNNHNMCPLSF